MKLFFFFVIKIFTKHVYFAGQEQHIGTKSIPREITLENAVLKPVDTGLVRMQVSCKSHSFFSRF